MKKIIIILFTVHCSLFTLSRSEAQVIRIPADYSTIQQGIDNANPGDTVLVSPGTYLENINFNGKSITVASLFLTTQDTAYISQTIIDGNLNNPAVGFWNEEDSTALLCGLTITKGRGGIYCYESNPSLVNLTIIGNLNPLGGWGPPLGGGGICCLNSNPIIKNVMITHNESSYNGGGIYCSQNSIPVLSNVTIAENTAALQGGGIYCTGSNPIFDADYRCNIYKNSALEGNDLFSDTLLKVIVDTFSVIYPSDFHAAPLANFSFDILMGKYLQVNADLYVSPVGDDSNDGLTSDEPLKTFHHTFSIILADSLNQNTVHILIGNYSPSTYPGIFPLDIPDYINLTGVAVTGVIFDAEGTSRVIHIMNNTSNHISGLTITGGFTLNDNGGGILCRNSKPTFEDVIITGNTVQSGVGYMNSGGGCGGGVFCDNSNPEFIDVVVTGNYAFMGSDPSTGYNGGFGGGMCFINSIPTLQNVTITGNSVSYHGGGICFWGSVPLFDTINRCNIYNNVASGHPYQYGGSDIYSDTLIDVVADTFTVTVPTGFHATPLSNFSFDILNGLHQPIYSDLYISPQGNNHNSGLSANEPLKNIQCAFNFILSDSLNPHTIHLLEGTYSRINNGEFYPLRMPEYTSIEGVSAQSAILDADSTLQEVIQIINNKSTHITGITMTGGTVGLTCFNSSPILRNVNLINNKWVGITSSFNAGPVPVLENAVISGNSGGGAYCDPYDESSGLNLKNVTILNDMASSGHAIIAGNSTSIINSILWDRFADAIVGSPTVTYSNIRGGWPGEGNFDVDPLFDTLGVYPLALKTGSPCINTGTPDTTGLFLPLTDLAGGPRVWEDRIDMGAYEWNNVSVPQVQSSKFKVQSYPNPFSSFTTLEYELEHSASVNLSIYNHLAQKVAVIADGEQTKGTHQVRWNAKDLTAGIYYYRLSTNDYRLTTTGKLVKN